MIRALPSLLLLCVCVSVSAAQDDAPVRARISAGLDAWHRAAATADADGVFGYMSEDAYYLGTDAGERWTKEQFVAFASPYFKQGRGWSFTPRERSITLSDDGNTAWFNEELDTWMGRCFGSGVLTYTAGRWLLRQYHLAFTVPNARIREVLDLLAGETAKD